MFRTVRLKLSLIAASVCALSTTAALAVETAPASPAMPSVVAAPTELNGQIVYELMLAEIAAARSDYPLAATAYVDLARRTQDARIARRATEVSLVGQQYPKAAEAARLWLQADPNSTLAMQTLAMALASGFGNLDELEPLLTRLLASGTAPIESMLLQLPRMYVRFPDKTAAAQSIERITEPYIAKPEAHLARAAAWAGAQDSTRAQAEAGEALKLRPDWEAAAMLRAQVAPADQRAQAMEELGEFAKHNPKARDAQVTYARWLVSEDRFDEGKDAYRVLKKAYPEDNDISYVVAGLAVQCDDYDTAETELQRLIDRKYRDTDLLRLQLGQLYEEKGDGKRAIEQYGQIGDGAHYPAAQARTAAVMAKNGDMAGGRALLEKAAAAADDPDAAARYWMAESQLLREHDQFDEAQKVMSNLLAKQPDNVDALYESAMLDDRLDRYGDMETKLRRIIQLKPDFAHAYNALGYSFVDRNVRLKEADELLSKAIGLAPDDGAIMDSMGWLRYRQGDLPGALDYLQRAYERMPDPEVAAHIGEVQWMMGNHDEAMRTWDAARKTGPDSPALNETIKRLTQ